MHKFYKLLRNRETRGVIIRETKSLLLLKAYWFSFYLIAAIISLAAAFNSDRIASLPDRALFVFSMVTVSAVGCSVIAGIWRAASGRSALEHADIMPKVFLIWLLVATIPIRLTLLTITDGSFDLSELVNAVVHGLSVSSIIALTFGLSHFGPQILRERSSPGRSSDASDDRPGKVDVPFYIESEDHYVKIVSAKGVEVVRARLSDLAEEFGEAGMRCHKSYWVSFDAISHKSRAGRQMRLVLKCGTVIPVGRSYEKAVINHLLTLGRGDLYVHSVKEQT